MRVLKLIPVLASLFMLNVASMCSNDDSNDDNNNQQDPTPVINTVSDGTWRITFYEDNGQNETNHYTGYNFTFGSSNVLTATNGTDTYTGAWSVSNSNSSDDDNPSNDLDFNIMFSSPTLFADELTDDWDILTYTSTKIELVDISGGNGGTDYLTFEKN